MPPPAVLVVDDKESVLELLVRILDSYELVTASDGARALDLLGRRSFDVVLTDIRMPGADGFEILRAARSRADRPEVVMMTAYATVPNAVSAMREGAYDYIAKPFTPEDLALVVARAIECRLRRSEGGAEPRSSGLPDERVESTTPYREAVEEARERASREYLVSLMRRFRGNVTHAARGAGMQRISLYRLLKNYGIKPEEYRRS